MSYLIHGDSVQRRGRLVRTVVIDGPALAVRESVVPRLHGQGSHVQSDAMEGRDHVGTGIVLIEVAGRRWLLKPLWVWGRYRYSLAFGSSRVRVVLQNAMKGARWLNGLSVLGVRRESS